MVPPPSRTLIGPRRGLNEPYGLIRAGDAKRSERDSRPPIGDTSRRRPDLTATESALERLDGDRLSHTLGPPPAPADLDRLEAELGRPLPAPFRELLERLGGGLYYGGHEIFGPTRVMIHDIELVPDVLSIRAQLKRQARFVPDYLLPIHRFGRRFHLLDLRRARSGEGLLTASDASAVYSELGEFLDAVVVPPRSNSLLDSEGAAEGT